MRNKLYRSEAFALFDRDGIAEYLTKMAAKGWMIHKLLPLFWVYRRIKPSKLRFHVSYFPHASPYDPKNTPELDEYVDLCGHTGWRFAATWLQAQIFYTADEDPTPMETEPELAVMGIHAAAMRSLVPFATFAVIYSAFALYEILTDAFPALTPINAAFVTTVFALVAVYYAVELTAYLLWHARAVRAAAKGEWVRYPHCGLILRIMQGAAFALLVGWAAAACVIGVGTEKLFIVGIVLVSAGLFYGVDIIRRRLGNIGLSRKSNWALTTAASLVVFAAISVFFHLL